MTIIEHIDCLDSLGVLQSTIASRYEEYHRQGFGSDWNEIAGNKASKDKASTDSEKIKSGDPDSIDYILSYGYIKRFLQIHKIKIIKAKETQNHIIIYVSCPWSENHTSESNDTEAFISIDKRNGMINYHCNHSHCNDKTWQDYKKFYEDRDKTEKKASEKEQKQIDFSTYPVIRGDELQDAHYDPLIHFVEGLIVQGYTVIAAIYKLGKSWFAQLLCISVCRGLSFMGYSTQKHATAYFALEDNEERLQERQNILLQGEKAPDNIYYVYKAPTLDEGFIDYLEYFISLHPDVKVIVIDVLAKIDYQCKRGETEYHKDYRTGTALKEFADKHKLAIVALTHTTKMKHDDPFMNTSGTNGVTGSADSIIAIMKEHRSDKQAILSLTSRCIKEKYLAIHMDDNCFWQNDGDTDPDAYEANKKEQEKQKLLNEYLDSDIRKAVIAIAKDGKNESIRAKSIIDIARDKNIYLLDSAMTIGGFIHNHQNRFTTEDGIRVEIIKSGTASSLYRFTYWDELSEDELPDELHD